MLYAASIATTLILATALWLCRRRLARTRARPGDPVDYGSVPGTRMFDAELTAVEPSQQKAAVTDVTDATDTIDN